MLSTAIFQKAIVQGNCFWRKHVLQRMIERGIEQNNVIETLLYGELIKEYQNDRPFPSGLFLYFVDGKPLHVVASFDVFEENVYIITVYEPSIDIFENDFKTKK